MDSTVYGSYTGGMLSNGQTLDITLSNSLINGDGTYELALIATSMPSNDSVFESREATNIPQLIITYSD